MSKEEALKEPNQVKSKIKFLLRILVSIIALFFLIKFGKVDLNTAFKYLLKANPIYFALAFLSYLATLAISAIRFYFSSHVIGFKKTYLQLLQLNFVGTFFNNFLPTTFGGDALRGYYLKRGSHVGLSKAAACIVYERFTGMVILFWAASATFILQDIGILQNSIWKIPTQFALFSHIGSFVTIFLIPLLPVLSKLILGKNSWLYKKFVEPFQIYWQDLKLLGRIIFLSVFLQMSVVISHIFIAKALDIQIPLSYYFIFYPLTTIGGFLIPSLNGLGVREGAYIYFLTKVNVPADQGMAFSICWLVILLVMSIVGGIVYTFGDFRKHKMLVRD